jgi:hypothetical protein
METPGTLPPDFWSRLARDFFNSFQIPFSAILMDFLWPNRLLLVHSWFFACSPRSVLHILVGLMAGYTDRTDTERYNESVIAFSVYLAAVLARRLIFTLLHLTLLLAHFIWVNVAFANTCCAVIGALLYLIREGNLVPFSWNPKTGEKLEWLQCRAIVGFTNLSYGTVTTIISLWKNMASATRTAVNIFWRATVFVFAIFGMQMQLRKKFSYSATPVFDGIRLLRLQRKWPFLDLRAELVRHDLKYAPPYHAISYVWVHGPQDMRPIILNGMEFYVRGNVYDILWRCSSYFGPRLVWIDSICIDQTNPKEKSLQVQKMADIYKRAEDVLVCLGDAPGAWLALGLIWELNFILERYGETYLCYHHVPTFFQRRQIDKLLCARVHALLDLLYHPWFERAWVVQEVVVARHVNIFYGRYSIPWSSLYDCMKPIGCGPVFSALSAFDSARRSFTSAPPLLSLSRICLLVGYRMEFQSFGPNSLCFVLRQFIQWKAELGIDKIFAIIGIVDCGADLKRLVDYKRPGKEIIVELANYTLETGHAVEILDLAGIGWVRHDPTLPTWVVEWNTTRAAMPLSHPSLRYMQYKAAVDRPSSVVRGNNEQEIVVRGQFIDRIKILGLDILRRFGFSRDSSFSEIINYLDEINNVAQVSAPDPYHHLGNQPLREAIWRTIIGDRSDTERPAPASYEKIMTAQISLGQKLEPYISRDGPEMFFKDLPKEFESEFGTTGIREEIRRTNMEFQNIDFLFDHPVSQRSFCVTERGYIGMVPHLSKVGDIVCVFFGAQVPFVLRSIDLDQGSTERYQLVGESYIHGIMDGQAFGLDYDETDFTLV